MKLKYWFDGCEYEYEADNSCSVIEEIFSEDYGLTITQSKNIIDDLELYDQLEELYEDKLKDWFEREAREQYEDDKEYDEDPDSFYGVSRYD